jgi:hypothetical protein
MAIARLALARLEQLPTDCDDLRGVRVPMPEAEGVA